MPLQIRRGTEFERSHMTVPLAAGELLYVTDEQRIYVGNGTTVGGIAVTGYTNEDAQNAAASLFTTGIHTGITFTYVNGSDRIDANVDLSTYNGPLSGDFNGSVYADDSLRLIDGTSGKFNLNGTINTNIIPDTDSAYDLGSDTYKFRDLYLSGSSIHIGSAIITSTGGVIDIPAGSTIGGVPFGSGGSDVSGNIIGDDSSVIVNTATKSITAAGGITGNLTGNVTGNITGVVTATAGSTMYGTLNGNVNGGIYGTVIGLAGSSLVGDVTGNVTGSVFATDSTLLIDGDVNYVSNGVIALSSNTISSTNNKINVKNGTTLTFDQSGDTTSIQINTLSAGLGNASKVTFSGFKNSLNTPADPIAGEYVGVISYAAYSSGAGSTVPLGLIGNKVDAGGTIGNDAGDGKFEIITASTVGGFTLRYLTFDSLGRLAVNQETASHTVDVNGDVNATLFLAGQQTSGSDFDHGYTFSGTEGGHDTGMFSAADGIIKLISNTNTVVTVNSNQTVTLAVLTAAPLSPVVGTIAVADGTSWDPASVGGLAYPVFFNGSTWIKMFS